jgi:hypothetical protein
MRLLRTIRLDPSDTLLFKRVAEPGEWAVSGTFAFAHADPATVAPSDHIDLVSLAKGERR